MGVNNQTLGEIRPRLCPECGREVVYVCEFSSGYHRCAVHGQVKPVSMCHEKCPTKICSRCHPAYPCDPDCSLCAAARREIANPPDEDKQMSAS